jgi:hypothetical protein
MHKAEYGISRPFVLVPSYPDSTPPRQGHQTALRLET